MISFGFSWPSVHFCSFNASVWVDWLMFKSLPILCNRFEWWLTIFHQRGRSVTFSEDHRAGSSVSPHNSLTYPTSILQCVVYLPGCSNVHSKCCLLPKSSVCSTGSARQEWVTAEYPLIFFQPFSVFSSLSTSSFSYLCLPGDSSRDWHHQSFLEGPSLLFPFAHCPPQLLPEFTPC